MTPSIVIAAVLAFQDPAVPQSRPQEPTPAEVRQSIDKGLTFLVAEQNKDGSWGGNRNKTFTDSFANRATMDAWVVGTTGLAVAALLQCGVQPDARAAAERGVDFLIANADVKRPDFWDNDNVWGSIYGLFGLARALGVSTNASPERVLAIRNACRTCVDGLARHQSPNGGWGYYADSGSAWRPEWATSFTTAAGALALGDARRAGVEVLPRILDPAVRAVGRARLPSGAFTYDVSAIPYVRGGENINEVKGSLGRMQIGNYLLHTLGGGVAEAERVRALEQFSQNHRFLDAALRKPIPHEAYYQNAAYFYLFGHYYAARLATTLPFDAQKPFWPVIRREVMKTQERDGGMWDFYISACTKPYGTAFGVMALQLSLGTAP